MGSGEVRRPTYTVKVTDPKTGEVRTERRQSEVWWVRYYRNGKRHEESSRSTKKGEAKRLLSQRTGAIANGEPVTAKVGRLTLGDALRSVVTDYKINAKRTTSDVEQRIRQHLVPYFGEGRRMVTISTDALGEYVAHRQREGAKNSTINRELAVIRRAFRLAERARTIVHRPHVPMLAENNVRQGFFEAEEFAAVREELPEHLQGVVTFAYFSGWRVPSEVLTLQWAQVDRKAETVRLEPGTTKNRDARVLPYGQLPELVEVIERQWAEHKRLAASGKLCPWVFVRPDGARIGSFRKTWAAACRAAGVHGRLLHDLRRSCVRALVRAGVPDTVAMKVTGHKTRSVFDRYNITSESDLRNALGRLSTGTGKEKGKSAETGRVRDFASR